MKFNFKLISKIIINFFEGVFEEIKILSSAKFFIVNYTEINCISIYILYLQTIKLMCVYINAKSKYFVIKL